MKPFNLSFLLFVCAFPLQQNFAQTLNFNSIQNTKHIITAGAGWDHGLSYSAGYTYKTDSRLPLFLYGNFSIASGEQVMDDFKTKLGGRLVLLNKKNLKASVDLNGIFRKYESPLVRLLNFGSEVKGTVGYYRRNWFVAGETGFDKAIVTHFKHSNTFRETIYAEVKDGWYEPATGGNFYYGLQTGYSLKKVDLTLNLGKVISQDFKTAPLIPFYLMVGVNFRLPKNSPI